MKKIKNPWILFLQVMRFHPRRSWLCRKYPLKGQNRNRRENPKKEQLWRREKETKDTESIKAIEKKKEEEPEIREFEEVSCGLVKEEEDSKKTFQGIMWMETSASISLHQTKISTFSNNRGIRYVGCERLEFEEMLKLRKREESRQRPKRYFRMDVFIHINMCLFMC